MTELEKFVKILREHLKNSKMGPHIGNLNRFVYLKQQYVVVDFHQLNIRYCEKFVEPAPKTFQQHFIRFASPAMHYCQKQAKYEFIFSYQNAQTFQSINLNQYRNDLIPLLSKKFDNYTFGLNSDHEIMVHLKDFNANWKDPKLEREIEGLVYNYNSRNGSFYPHLPAATYFKLTDYYGQEAYIFSVNF